MGLTSSHQEDISRSHLSNEIEDSLEQVLHAFRRNGHFFTRHHQTTSKTDLVNIQKEQKQQEQEEEEDSSHHRSHSLDEQKHISRKSSLVKRQWQCQLCQILNENDSQLCSNCGSSKINVYIPTMNQNDKTKTTNDSSTQNR
jgi:hypothetical protein